MTLFLVGVFCGLVLAAGILGFFVWCGLEVGKPEYRRPTPR